MIKLTGISKSYGSHKALNDIFLEIQDGQVVGILGENGAGKTTLLKALAGLILLDSGEFEYDDVNNLKEERQKIAYITEEGSFFPFLTANKNAEFFEDFYDEFDMDRFLKLCEFLEIPMDKKARSFSKGQKAKLEVALGFSKGAKYIFLDEPFLGNDIFTRRNFLKLMCNSLIDDETIIIATHSIDEIENFLDRAVFIQKGKIIKDIRIEEMQENHQTLEGLMKTAFAYDEDKFNKLFT